MHAPLPRHCRSKQAVLCCSSAHCSLCSLSFDHASSPPIHSFPLCYCTVAAAPSAAAGEDRQFVSLKDEGPADGAAPRSCHTRHAPFQAPQGDRRLFESDRFLESLVPSLLHFAIQCAACTTSTQVSSSSRPGRAGLQAVCWFCAYGILNPSVLMAANPP